MKDATGVMPVKDDSCDEDAAVVGDQGPYAPQGRTSLLPKLSLTSKVSAPTSYA